MAAEISLLKKRVSKLEKVYSVIKKNTSFDQTVDTNVDSLAALSGRSFASRTTRWSIRLESVSSQLLESQWKIIQSVSLPSKQNSPKGSTTFPYRESDVINSEQIFQRQRYRFVVIQFVRDNFVIKKYLQELSHVRSLARPKILS